MTLLGHKEVCLCVQLAGPSKAILYCCETTDRLAVVLRRTIFNLCTTLRSSVRQLACLLMSHLLARVLLVSYHHPVRCHL